RATLFLRDDNTVDHVIASDEVQAHMNGDSPVSGRAGHAEFAVNEAQDGISHAVFQNDVQVESGGDRPSRINAGRMQLDFSGENRVSRIRADGSVKLAETAPQQDAGGTAFAKNT